jgi:ribosomal protein L11 methyltransferase
VTNLWYEITATAPPREADAVAVIMRDFTPGGVAVEEPIDILDADQGFLVRGDEPVLVRGYVPGSELGAVLISDLRIALASFPAVELTARPIYEQDWAVSWREFFGVVDTGGRVIIVPSWIAHEPEPWQLVIRLDPGQAFGTGHHETTRLCLRALEEAVTPGSTVLDVGTGSGVLAIAAALLGAEHVTAIDIDPIAAGVAVENVAENGVAGRVSVTAGTLGEGTHGRHEIVVANISSEANIGLAEQFAAALLPGGRLLLSGLLSSDQQRVGDAMRQQGLRLAAVRHERDWCLLEFLAPS